MKKLVMFLVIALSPIAMEASALPGLRGGGPLAALRGGAGAGGGPLARIRARMQERRAARQARRDARAAAQAAQVSSSTSSSN